MSGVVVSGASGYIGSDLLRLGTRSSTVGLEALRSPGGVKYRLRLGADDEQLRSADILIHLAWSRRGSGRDQVGDNINGVSALLRQCAIHGVRMLFVSSYAVLFSSGTAYARAKSSLEQLVLASGGQVARVGLVWSAHSGGPVATLAKMSNLGYPLPIPRSRRVVVHLAHLDDVVQSLLGLAIMDHEAAASNPVSHLAHREPYDLVEVLSGLRSREGRLRTVRIPLPVLYTGIGVAHALRLLPLSVDHARGLFSSTATPDDLLGSEAFRPFDPATGGTRR